MFPLTRLRCLTLLTRARVYGAVHAFLLLGYETTQRVDNQYVCIISIHLSILTLTFTEKMLFTENMIADNKSHDVQQSSNMLTSIVSVMKKKTLYLNLI